MSPAQVKEVLDDVRSQSRLGRVEAVALFTSVRERRRSRTARTPYSYGVRSSRTGLAIWDLPYSTARPRTDWAVRVRRHAVQERTVFLPLALLIVSFTVTVVMIKSISIY